LSIANEILSTVGSVIGLLPTEKPMLSDNFFDIGGNSINAVLVMAKLEETGYKIDIGQFIGAETILDIIKIALSSDQGPEHLETLDNSFKLRNLKLEDRDQVSANIL